jgi:hypothetical protein
MTQSSSEQRDMIRQLVANLNRDLQRELSEYIGISQKDRMKKYRVIHHIKQRFLNSDIYRLRHRLTNIYKIETFEDFWFGMIDDIDYFEKGIIFGKELKNPSCISH